jgi:hypothetical protein
MKQGGIVGVPVQERAIDADGMVVEPATLRVQNESVERALVWSGCRDGFVRLEEAGIADAERRLPATVTVIGGLT